MRLPVFSILSLVLTLMMQPAKAQSHEAWTQLLGKYVQENSDGINRVDYARLKESDLDRRKLRTYIEEIAQSEIFNNGTSEQSFAAWANLYNALTIELVVKNYPVDSIRDIGGNFISRGPWNRDIVEVDGSSLSLNDIEHKILRKKWNDPRVHYAVNCASIGCPNLQKTAWEAETLDIELDRAATEFINHPRGVEVLPDGRLKLSSIYRWFKEDFGDSQVGSVMHLMKFASPSLASNLSAETMVKSYQYDWSLNDIKK